MELLYNNGILQTVLWAVNRLYCCDTLSLSEWSGEQIYEVENDEKYILYDFSKEVGESWYLPKYDDTVSVLEKEIMFLENGDSCIRLTISNLVDENPWYFCGYLNNCFGREYGTLFPDPQTTGAGGVNEIRCYLMDGEMIYKEGVYACEYDHTSVDVALFPMELWRIGLKSHLNSAQCAALG